MFVVVRVAGRQARDGLSKLAHSASLSTSVSQLQAQKVAPRLSQTIQTIRPQITLKHCGGVVPFVDRRGASVATARKEECPTEYVPEEPRPLAVLMTWLAAQDKHIEKYRTLWMQRGFDVLTVKMTPYQLLLPKLGSHVLIQDLIKFLYGITPIYPEIILQGFSVGAYCFGELLAHLNDEKFMKTIQRKDDAGDPKTTIENAIRGVILDSIVTFEGIGKGVSRSITDNMAAAKILETSINSHLKLSYPIATKYYIRASDNAHNNYLKVPGLMICSKADPIGNAVTTTRAAHMWRDNGIDCTLRVFNDSKHVQHYSTYPQEYIGEIDGFLKKVNLSSLQ